VVLSVGTTGFTTMALTIVWLFAFQNLYGYVYSRIGWIVALFMAGLVIGCWLAARGLGRASGAGPWGRLVLVDLLLASLALAIPFVLPTLGAVQSTRAAFMLVEAAVSLMVALTGVLGGAAFALAGGLQLSLTGDAAMAAGAINGSDHAGACLGALLTGILLVPVFGTLTAALLLGAVKLASVAMLLVGRRAALA
jgi:spermidine synthase